MRKASLEVVTITDGSNEARKGVRPPERPDPAAASDSIQVGEESEAATKSNSQTIRKLLAYGGNDDS